jgi:hypothetical protein
MAVKRFIVQALNDQTNGLYNKHVTIVNDDASVIIKWSFKLIDDPRVIIYNRQATDHKFLYLNIAIFKANLHLKFQRAILH